MELPPLNIRISVETPEERSFRALPYFVQASLIERAQKMGIDPIDLHRYEQPVLDTVYHPDISYSVFLDNCTNAVQNTPEEESSMAYKRVKLPVGMDNHGNPIDRQIGGDSEAERFTRGIQAAVASGRIKEFSIDTNSKK